MSTQKNGAPASVPEFVPVVIIGAGPAGLTAATLLGQYGVDCLVLDRHETVYPLPRAVHADDEVHRLLARLGIGEEFAAHSRPAMGLRLIDPDMRVLAEIPRSPQPSATHGFPPMNMFDQPELETMLRANLKRYSNVTLRGNVEVTAVTQTQSDRVGVKFLDRVRGGEQSVQARYVLGCDGANSPTRAAIGAYMYGLPFTQDWLVIDVNTDAELNQWEGCHQLCNPKRAGTYMRISDTRYRWEFQLVDGETAANFKTIADVEPLIRPWLGDTPADALQLVRITSYTFRAQVANSWRDRNVFLLGDAAHLTPPFVGQGMAAGVRDALNLTWKLVGVLENSLPASVLESYEQERKLHVAAMILMAVSVGAAMTGGGRAGDLIRQVVFPRMHSVRLPGTRASAVEGVTPGLRSSELVIKSRRPGGLAGTLCPNPILGDGRRFDEVVGNRFALVTSSSLTEELRNELSDRGAVLVLAAPGTELDAWLRKGRAGAAIVRPDRTVMQAGPRVEALCQAVPEFHGYQGAADPIVHQSS
ncbi:bifunctional 3-(3-hydroxy-phenyl)propionate/3-hydroxycinnamic acid hydroxylase [Mycobacterium cookii]|uniref:3-(3-hydroxyphenyl)propionate hydroxylase n=1 Tax=Mycobacterium cookii TaxID=1775 RepID=A0A7I7KPY5_9MYCO|nr:bifunctional 3-(3-hydroxy-phenyl)propionate/3-hydroxycinnamic acid hydroxylase [Mycobacterium cookii]MCV7331999.1 bifunctional 3-(3-hydroxy-phenyl)propionate/3-hydroxycinnamic acid hydroxylase [Mycobacterium cookii]BBX44155.1 3-(3-hydroxyphenyl)propionate hydroxylase [Mycobacterium cookii]